MSAVDAPPAEPDDPPAQGPARWQVPGSLPTWLFAVFVAVSFWVLLLGLGRYHWFLRDEWVFFVERRAFGADSLFEPFNVHPVAVPVLAYIALYNTFGIDSYRPYQAVVIALHLAVVVMVHAIARRSGVRPWLAAPAAALLVLFGPGYQNIIWAFQIGFTGAVALGLAQMLLADHDGPVGRRDALGVAAGVLAVMSTGVGVTMAVITGGGLLLRRGWARAALHTAPLAAVYGTWYLVQRPEQVSPFGRPPVGAVVEWVRSTALATFAGLGHHRAVAIAFAVVLVVGFALAWLPAVRAGIGRVRRGADGRDGASRAGARAVHRLAFPTAMLGGAVLFPTTTALVRWYGGPGQARASRYVHLCAVLVVPALAVGAEELARRWRALVPVLAVLLLVPIPANLDGFQGGVFGQAYMRERERILTTVVRMPFAREVPRDVRPIPDRYDGDLTIGFLLDAYDEGRLAASTAPVPAPVVNEMRIRLGLAQGRATEVPSGCRTEEGPVEVHLDEGDVIGLVSPARVSTVDDGQITSRPVDLDPGNGVRVTAVLDDLDLRFEPNPWAPRPVVLCANA